MYLCYYNNLCKVKVNCTNIVRTLYEHMTYLYLLSAVIGTDLRILRGGGGFWWTGILRGGGGKGPSPHEFSYTDKQRKINLWGGISPPTPLGSATEWKKWKKLSLFTFICIAILTMSLWVAAERLTKKGRVNYIKKRRFSSVPPHNNSNRILKYLIFTKNPLGNILCGKRTIIFKGRHSKHQTPLPKYYTTCISFTLFMVYLINRV